MGAGKLAAGVRESGDLDAGVRESFAAWVEECR